MIRLGQSPGRGRGVFATQRIPRGQLIERCPVIELRESPALYQCELKDYQFDWPGGSALALGLGSIYNHAYEPNAFFVPDPKRGEIRFYAYRDIDGGDEIFVNYNGPPGDRYPVKFDVR